MTENNDYVPSGQDDASTPDSSPEAGLPAKLVGPSPEGRALLDALLSKLNAQPTVKLFNPQDRYRCNPPSAADYQSNY